MHYLYHGYFWIQWQLKEYNLFYASSFVLCYCTCKRLNISLLLDSFRLICILYSNQFIYVTIVLIRTTVHSVHVFVTSYKPARNQALLYSLHPIGLVGSSYVLSHKVPEMKHNVHICIHFHAYSVKFHVHVLHNYEVQ